ncbi:MAG: ferredoxin [Patescibacteria group bacterium]|jgi:ferredoxin
MHEKKVKIGKIEVDRDLCISSADCVAIAGATFELDEDGIARVKDPKGNDDETILEAARACPVKAIVIYDEDGNKIYPKD